MESPHYRQLQGDHRQEEIKVMISIALAATLAFAPLTGQDSAPSQAAPATQQPVGSPDPVELEDVEVTGRRLESLIEQFVNEVAEPNRDRGLARWEGSVCVGAANLRQELAQYLVDRVSTVAEDIGLMTGQPGCNPNIIILATDDGEGTATVLTDARRGSFRFGGAGMDRGRQAFEEFRESDRPVRWWQVALPIDSQTGRRAVRIPGDCTGACTSPLDMAPQINVFAPSRLSTQIVNNLVRTIVIVDVSKTDGMTALQLADYIAMVSLAQIDPDADTSAYASILNVFNDPDAADSLTQWDTAYLAGLYDAERTRKVGRASRSEIAASIQSAHQRLNAIDDNADEPQ